LARRDGGVLVTLLNELLGFLISGHSQQRQLVVGTSITRSVSAAMQTESVDIVRPDQDSEHIQLKQRGSAFEFTYSGTDLAGFYQIKTGPPINDLELLAVNPDPRESNLEKLQQAHIQRHILPKENTSYGTVWRNVRRPNTSSQPDSSGLVRWLLYATLLLLIVEQIMAWRFDYGLLLLLVLIVTALTSQLLPGGTMIAGLVLFASCVVWAARRYRTRHHSL
jgi:hypothetical protein